MKQGHVMLLALALSCGAAQFPAPFLGLWAGQARAQGVVDISALSQALMITSQMEILRDEGLANGQELAADLPGNGAAGIWARRLDRLYDAVGMEKTYARALAQDLGEDPQTVEASLAFFTSDLGRRILELELSARRALEDDAVKAAAKRAWAGLPMKNPVRRGLFDRLLAANDLIETNVMGALNANLAFLMGLHAAGDNRLALPETEALALVWSSEADTRAATIDWLYPFLTLAYEPLSEADLRAYVAFSESAEGRRLNAAMFRAFDTLYTGLSQEVGRAFGAALQGDDI